MKIALACAGFVVVLLTANAGGALRVEVLRSVGGLPAHIVSGYEEPVRFQQADNGLDFNFHPRGHTVHTVAPDRTGTRNAVAIGQEDGRVVQPNGVDIAPDGRFVVADLPRAQQRIQTFTADGTRLSGFFLPGQPAARIIIGNLMLNGAGSVQHTGETLLVSHPESGALITEYSTAGYAL